MTKPKSIFALAIKTAHQSEGVGKRQCYRMGAVLYHGKKPIIAKPNSNKNHAINQLFTDRPIRLHAEANVIKSIGINACRNKSLFVVRVQKDGRTTMSKPCDSCQELIKLVGIKKVFYTNWQGRIEEWRP